MSKQVRQSWKNEYNLNFWSFIAATHVHRCNDNYLMKTTLKNKSLLNYKSAPVILWSIIF